MRVSAPALVVTHLLAAGTTYALTDRRPIDTEVQQEGFFKVDTTKVLATTVESLRLEGKLLVFSYKGSAKVRTDRRWLWLFRGSQELIVPAVVNYYLPLENLTLADVVFDEKAKLVRIKLPRLVIGDIAFQPEQATTINGGVLTYGEETVEALRKLNYHGARRGMVAQSQQRSLLDMARANAVKDIQSYFEIPLRIAQLPDVKVVASFD